MFSTPISPHTDIILVKKNPANQIARFGAYPSRRSLLAVSVQKFQVICINQPSTDRHLNIYDPSGSINQLSDVFWHNAARFVAGFYFVWCSAYGRGTGRIEIRFYGKILREMVNWE
jgi:hypothetical protein